MKKFFIATLIVLLFNISCKKENPVLSNYKEIVNVDLKNLSNEQMLEYFSKIEFKDFSLHNFSIKKVNDIPVQDKSKKADFTKDKIDFNVKANFVDKNKFFSVLDQKIDISDTKKDGYLSTSDASVFISGYFKDGKFYFKEAKKLGY